VLTELLRPLNTIYPPIRHVMATGHPQIVQPAGKPNQAQGAGNVPVTRAAPGKSKATGGVHSTFSEATHAAPTAVPVTATHIFAM